MSVMRSEPSTACVGLVSGLASGLVSGFVSLGVCGFSVVLGACGSVFATVGASLFPTNGIFVPSIPFL